MKAPNVLPVTDEPETSAYQLAARFNTERQAERTYFRLQEYVRTHPDELESSVYRVLLRGVSVVAVVGDDPGEEPGRHIERELSRGQRVTLEEDLLRFLLQRREQGTQLGPWVERHHRPGLGFWFDR